MGPPTGRRTTDAAAAVERGGERVRRYRRACFEQFLQAAAIGCLERQLRAQFRAQLGVEPGARELLVGRPSKERAPEPAAERRIRSMRTAEQQRVERRADR